MIWPFKQILINYYTIKEIKKMPEDLKTQGLSFLKTQSPRVIIALITIGALVGMQWFGKLTDVLAICVTVAGSVALVTNYLIVKGKL